MGVESAIMIRFSWQKVRQKSKTNRQIIEKIEYLTWPDNYRRIRTDTPELFWGESFIINPEPFLIESKGRFPAKYLVEYIYIASLRSLADYQMYGRKTLDSRLLLIDVSHNSLIKIENNTVILKYE